MTRKILVVEDEVAIRDMLCLLLEQKGFSPEPAADYQQALDLLKEPYPELILLDWMLPGGSGIQFIKQLKQHELTRHIPVIMLTARAEEEDKIKGLDVGADDYITNPSLPKS